MCTPTYATLAFRYPVRSPWYALLTSPAGASHSVRVRVATSGCGRSGRVAGAVVSPTPSPASRFGPTSYSSVAHQATTRCLAELSTRHRRRWPMTGRLPRGNRRKPFTAYPGDATWATEETLASRGSNPRRRLGPSACLMCVHTGMEARLAVHPFMLIQYSQKPPPSHRPGRGPTSYGSSAARACGLHRT